MNQLEKIKFWNKKYNLDFLGCHFLVIFVPLTYFLGPLLWFQSLMLSVLCILFFCFMFDRHFGRSFKGEETEGYDAWHLKPLKDQHLNKAQVFLTPHHLPFFVTYHFLGKQQVFFSDSFLEKFQKEQWFTFLMSYFNTGGVKKATYFSYILFVLFFPFFLFEKLALKWKFFYPMYAVLFSIISYPITSFIKKHFHEMDQKNSSHFLKTYAEDLEKMQCALLIEPLNKHLCFASLLPINALTHSRFYLSMHPSIEERAEHLGIKFPI